MLNGYIACIGGGDDDNAQSIIDDLLGATITRSQEVLSDRYIDPRLDLCRQYVDKGQRHTALIMQCSTVSGAIEGDEPSLRVAYVEDDNAEFIAEGR